MRLTLFFISILLHIAVLSWGQNTSKEDLAEFNTFLGTERAVALSDAVDSFDRFLQTNYPEFDNRRGRSTAFLNHMIQHNEPKESWILETERNSKIIETFESTGLRKEIWVYGYEEYQSQHDFSEVLLPEEPDTTAIRDLGELVLELIEEEIVPYQEFDSVEVARIEKDWEEKRRNSLHTNNHGDFLFAILKYTPQESFAYGVAEAKHKEGNISPGAVAYGFFENVSDYSDPFVRRLMVTEFYFAIMNWDINRKR